MKMKEIWSALTIEMTLYGGGGFGVKRVHFVVVAMTKNYFTYLQSTHTHKTHSIPFLNA